jgi:hypothetical protein
VTNPSSPPPRSDEPRPRRWYESTPFIGVLAVVALTVGIVLSRSATQQSAARANDAIPSDCARFPGACAPGGASALPPAELTPLAMAVEVAETAWTLTEQTERTAPIFPEKSRTALLGAVRESRDAVLDALAMVAGLDTTTPQRVGALVPADSLSAGIIRRDVLRDAYLARHALLSRATLMVTRRVERTATSPLFERSIDRGVSLVKPVATESATVSGAVALDAVSSTTTTLRPLAMQLRSGAIRIIGWKYDSLHVRGVIAPGEKWEFVADADTMRIHVHDQPRGLAAATDMEIFVPFAASLTIRAANASMVLEQLAGALDITTAGGNLLFENASGDVRAETTRGTLTVNGSMPTLHALTATGDLTVRSSAPLRTAELRSISGRMQLEAPSADSVRAHTVSSQIEITVGAIGAVLRATSHLGQITVTAPAALDDRMVLQSARGRLLRPAR